MGTHSEPPCRKPLCGTGPLSVFCCISYIVIFRTLRTPIRWSGAFLGWLSVPYIVLTISSSGPSYPRRSSVRLFILPLFNLHIDLVIWDPPFGLYKNKHG